MQERAFWWRWSDEGGFQPTRRWKNKKRSIWWRWLDCGGSNSTKEERKSRGKKREDLKPTRSYKWKRNSAEVQLSLDVMPFKEVINAHALDDWISQLFRPTVHSITSLTRNSPTLLPSVLQDIVQVEDETSTLKRLTEANYSANGFHQEKQKRVLELPAQKNVLTNYFCLTSTEAKRQFKAPRIMLEGHEQSEELPFSAEGNSLLNIKTSDFESMLQGSTPTLKRSMSGLFDDIPAFRKSFLSDDLENDSKEGRDIISAYECGTIFGKDEDIRRKEPDALEISAKSASDITFQAIGSGKLKPLVPSRKIIGCRQASNVPAEKVTTGVKRGTIVRSRYFCSEISDIDLESEDAQVLPSKQDVSDMDLVQKTIDATHCSEKVSDKIRNVSSRPPQQMPQYIQELFTAVLTLGLNLVLYVDTSPIASLLASRPHTHGLKEHNHYANVVGLGSQPRGGKLQQCFGNDEEAGIPKETSTEQVGHYNPDGRKLQLINGNYPKEEENT
ncbi:hypothetical protein KI387_024276 [Taxus chinensis]|uniref:Uncharacterized protein n=1 Tax=Taxus chinensis TaxID=29808 RepID=A0AA38L8D0_TAXCH|nr:hypothetical protein KI387_024276 [Taxus chinensis]